MAPLTLDTILALSLLSSFFLVSVASFNWLSALFRNYNIAISSLVLYMHQFPPITGEAVVVGWQKITYYTSFLSADDFLFLCFLEFLC
jgi:hypothetical protein